MSKQREAFEAAWANRDNFNVWQDPYGLAQEVWEFAWQASRAAALEEAARLIESYEPLARPVGFSELTFAIRALKEQS